MQKIISFGIPCYNSAEYMDHCISSIVYGSGQAEDIQVIMLTQIGRASCRERV